MGRFNKAVSAAYFPVRMAAEAFLIGMRTRKDDKVAGGVEAASDPGSG